MCFSITDLKKFGVIWSYRLTGAPLLQYHSMVTYKAIINISCLWLAMVSYIIYMVSFKIQINNLFGMCFLKQYSKNLYFKQKALPLYNSSLQDTQTLGREKYSSSTCLGELYLWWIDFTEFISSHLGFSSSQGSAAILNPLNSSKKTGILILNANHRLYYSTSK